MKIELSEYDDRSNGERMGIYLSKTVKELKQISQNKYSVKFGDYELIFISESKRDITRFRQMFINEPILFPSDETFDIKVILKKNDKIFRVGKYLYREFHTNTIGEIYDGILSLHIDAGNHNEYDIYFIPEINETSLQIFDKIFPDVEKKGN